ncbi:MAG: cytochrome C oxidase subunit IV family protein [Acidobacteria bacterium]|nr:cytochrome C oxidase subunit IV family protein [Acidobacteriota bacterium]
MSDTSEHISSPKLYVAIWLLLMVCTALTVGAAFIDLGPLNTIVALGIATLKAVVVVLYFMHVKYTHERMTKAVVVSGFFFLLLLLALSMMDYTTRGLG